MKNGDDRIDLFWLRKKRLWKKLRKLCADKSWIPKGRKARDKFRENVLRNAMSVGYLINKNALDDDPGGDFAIEALTHREMLVVDKINTPRYAPEKGERFLKQPSIRGATVFLVAPDIILTVAHSLKRRIYFKEEKGDGLIDIAEMNEHVRVIFGYQISNKSEPWMAFDAEQVFSIEKVLAKCENPIDEDWVLLKLSKSVDQDQFSVLKLPVPPVALKTGDPLYVLGHPRGLPLKFCPNGKVVSRINSIKCRADLDCYKGNSGSPIFHTTTHQVAGMLLKGEADYELDHMQKCIKSKVIDAALIGDPEIQGERFQSIESIYEAIKKYLP